MRSLVRALHTRGLRNLLHRFFRIASRYGFTTHKGRRCLKLYAKVLNSFGCNATLAVCGIVAQRYPRIVREAATLGYEIACHGFTHTDYGKLTLEQQIDDLKKSSRVFCLISIEATGFRGPYLASNNQTPAAIRAVGMRYISNETILWDVMDDCNETETQSEPYRKAMEMYRPNMASEQPSLPVLSDGLVIIPVSLPDDELLVDRLGITRPERISAIWRDILNMSYERGELFTLMLHPERINICCKALENLLEEASSKEPPVWIATLNQIAEWWRERSTFTFTVETCSDKLSLRVNCSDRATVLIKDLTGQFTGEKLLYGPYRVVNTRIIPVEHGKIPVLGVAKDVPKFVARGLIEEGFFLERSNDRLKYGIYLDADNIGPRTVPEIVKMVDITQGPLLRFWRWPDAAKSAMAVTGDVDAITFADYLYRALRK